MSKGKSIITNYRSIVQPDVPTLAAPSQTHNNRFQVANVEVKIFLCALTSILITLNNFYRTELVWLQLFFMQLSIALVLKFFCLYVSRTKNLQSCSILQIITHLMNASVTTFREIPKNIIKVIPNHLVNYIIDIRVKEMWLLIPFNLFQIHILLALLVMQTKQKGKDFSTLFGTLSYRTGVRTDGQNNL